MLIRITPLYVHSPGRVCLHWNLTYYILHGNGILNIRAHRCNLKSYGRNLAIGNAAVPTRLPSFARADLIV